MEAPRYLHLKPGDSPPELKDAVPFKAVIVAESVVTPEWQAKVSDWLVRGGCRYMMAWGKKCSEWNDSVDIANLERFDFGDIPDDDFVMTTWHESDSLQETFWYSIRCATHSTLELEKTYLVHIAPEGRDTELLEVYRAAQVDADENTV